MPISVAIIEDHPLIVRGLTSVLEDDSDLCVCGVAKCAPGGLRLLRDKHPDIAVVDIGLDQGSGLDVVQELDAAHGRGESQFCTKSIVSSMREADPFASISRSAGASGFVSKFEPLEVLVGAIKSVAAGHPVFPLTTDCAQPKRTTARKQNRGEINETQTANVQDMLSVRELQVFRLIGAGHDAAEISHELSVSRKTVETFRARLKKKLGLDTPTRLVHFATKWCLVNA